MKIDVENKGIEDKLFDDLCSFYKGLPLTHAVGLSLVYLGNGVSGVKMKVKHDFTAVNGRLQGGFTAVLADNVMGLAIRSLGFNRLTTVDMHINYLSPVFDGAELLAEGKVIKAGKTIFVAEAKVIDGEGKLVAQTVGTFV